MKYAFNLTPYVMTYDLRVLAYYAVFLVHGVNVGSMSSIFVPIIN